MFLAWINQMVALLDKDEGEAILQILQNIAKEYPQALIHPLRISGEQYLFDDSPEGKKRKQEVERFVNFRTKSRIPSHFEPLFGVNSSQGFNSSSTLKAQFKPPASPLFNKSSLSSKDFK